MRSRNARAKHELSRIIFLRMAHHWYSNTSNHYRVFKFAHRNGRILASICARRPFVVMIDECIRHPMALQAMHGVICYLLRKACSYSRIQISTFKNPVPMCYCTYSTAPSCRITESAMQPAEQLRENVCHDS